MYLEFWQKLAFLYSGQISGNSHRLFAVSCFNWFWLTKVWNLQNRECPCRWPNLIFFPNKSLNVFSLHPSCHLVSLRLFVLVYFRSSIPGASGQCPGLDNFSNVERHNQWQVIVHGSHSGHLRANLSHTSKKF